MWDWKAVTSLVWLHSWRLVASPEFKILPLFSLTPKLCCVSDLFTLCITSTFGNNNFYAQTLMGWSILCRWNLVSMRHVCRLTSPLRLKERSFSLRKTKFQRTSWRNPHSKQSDKWLNNNYLFFFFFFLCLIKVVSFSGKIRTVRPISHYTVSFQTSRNIGIYQSF